MPQIMLAERFKLSILQRPFKPSPRAAKGLAGALGLENPLRQHENIRKRKSRSIVLRSSVLCSREERRTLQKSKVGNRKFMVFSNSESEHQQ